MMAFGKDLDEDLLKQKSWNKDLPLELESSNLMSESKFFFVNKDAIKQTFESLIKD